MTASISSPPSVDELLGRLHDEQDRLSALRQGVIHGVPRPPLLIILLILAMTGLVAVLTVQIVLLGKHMESTLEAIRHRRADDRVAARALPAASQLVDTTVFTKELAQRPQDAGRLGMARAAALIDHDPAAALAALDVARLTTWAALPAAAAVLRAECLARLAQHDQARRAVLAMSLRSLTVDERQRALRLLSPQGEFTPETPP